MSGGIVILGAGPTGLGAAYRLAERNEKGFEIFARCRIAGWTVAEVIVRHFPREAGQSIHRPFKMAGTIARVIRYLFDLRAEMRQSEAMRRLVAKGRAK